MEKIVGEEDLKGLEEEIDSAVNRLFVDAKRSGSETLSTEPVLSEAPLDKKPLDKKIPPAEPLSMESPTPEPIHEAVKTRSIESPVPAPPRPADKAPKIKAIQAGSEAPIPSSPEPLSYVTLFERMETQLLSLEWEITGEHLEKTREEVLALQQNSSDRTDVSSVLNFMEKVLSHMLKNQEQIDPQQVKFLLDSKDAVKLLLKKETTSEMNSFKQMLLTGIGARFLCLDGLRGTRTKPPSPATLEEGGQAEILKISEAQTQKILRRIGLLSEKLDEMINRFEDHLSRFPHMPQGSPKDLLEKKPQPLDLTIFRIDEKLFGIESQKVFKLFKLPNTYQEKVSGQQKIRLKEFEIQMVDLKRILSIGGKGKRAEIQVLTVKESGEYKGWMVDQILKKSLVEADISKDYGEYFMGMARWTYQEKPVKVPILNLRMI